MFHDSCGNSSDRRVATRHSPFPVRQSGWQSRGYIHDRVGGVVLKAGAGALVMTDCGAAQASQRMPRGRPVTEAGCHQKLVDRLCGAEVPGQGENVCQIDGGMGEVCQGCRGEGGDHGRYGKRAPCRSRG